MLFKLSLSNIKRSFKDYSIYFITLILGVCIFYIFNSIDSQTAMLVVSSRQNEIIKLLMQALSYVSVFVSFILGFLIIYASRFLIKKRNKEFGIYMMLGMSKRKISFILLLETFIIGLLSLIVGLSVGILLSQITSIFIANMFEADMTRFQFSFSSSAMIKTVIYYGIIYLIVMIFNTISVSKNKLINLIQASKRSENIKLKNPFVCILLFIISIGMLGYAYYMVTGGIESLFSRNIEALVIPILLGIIGTILFFYSFAGILLKVLSKCHKIYYKKLNAFVFKQISSKANTMVVSISMICIMLFFTLCLLSSAFTIKNYFNESIDKYAPVDFQIIGYNEEKYSANVMDFIDNDEYVKNNTKDITLVNAYYDELFDYQASLGVYYSELKEKYPMIEYGSSVYVLGETDYNKLAKVYNMDSINLNKDEYAIVSNIESNIYKEVIKRNNLMKIFNKNLKPTRLIDGFIEINANPSNLGYFVVDDSVVLNQNIKFQTLVGNYSSNDKNVIKTLDNKVNNFVTNYLSVKDTKTNLKESSIGLSAIVTFIGLYLGIIFLISSSAILALKQLSDSIDDMNKYKMLRQIGVDEMEINKSLFKQTFVFFMMPLALAIVHTIFGIKFCMYILSSLGISDLLNGVFTTFLFLLLIYGIYFIITYICSKKIIKE